MIFVFYYSALTVIIKFDGLIYEIIEQFKIEIN